MALLSKRQTKAHRAILRRGAGALAITVCATVAGLCPPTMRASSQTEALPGISAIQIAGQPILVFDHVVDKTAPNHIPDLPSTAWKEADGTVDVTVPHFENHRMRGPDLESVTSDPHTIFDSTSSASDVVEAHYNYHHWLSAPYTFDGQTIYALAHTEWYACELVGDCGFSTPTQYSTGNDWLNSWANTVTSMVSRDRGASWAMNGLNEAHVVSNESFTWTGSTELAQRIYHVALNHSGMMSPSRLVREGSYYYTIGFLNHRDFTQIDPVTHVAPIDKYDWALMRTTDPRQQTGWEGWVSGSTYVPLATHGFSAFSPPSGGTWLNAGEPQIIFDTNAQLYIAIFVVWGNPGAIYYTTTPSLAQPVWSNAVAIGGSAALQTNPRSPAACSVGFVVNDYVSIIDRHSDGYNFELTDGDPSLFYVYNPANTCGGDNLARDLYRVKLNIVYTTVARPSFATQPVSSRVAAGRPSAFAIAAGGAASYQWQVSTDHGISWSNAADGATYTGSATTTLSIPHATAALEGTQYRCIATNAGINAISNAATLTVTQPPASDFDGDEKADLAIWRPTTGQWWRRESASNYTTYQVSQWGLPGDIPVQGDFDGDGRDDIAVYRPSSGVWYVLKSGSNFTAWSAYQWGVAGDLPVRGDYDGDAITDIAVFRPSTGSWYVLTSSSGFSSWVIYSWGTAGDVPAPGDFDGDGRTDIAVYRPSTGAWYVLKSGSNFTSWTSYQWGIAGDVPVASDYDGDGQTDIAVFRPSSGAWFVLKSSTNFTAFDTYQWGLASDVPVPNDYDGDGKADIAQYRPSTGSWFVLKSTTNYTTWNIYQWGTPGDSPILGVP